MVAANPAATRRIHLCVGEQTGRATRATSTLTPSAWVALARLWKGPAMMIRRKTAQPVKRSTLAQQQSDFTAEGSPPPGKVAASEPVSVKEAAAPAPARMRPVRKGPPVGRSRWQR